MYIFLKSEQCSDLGGWKGIFFKTCSDFEVAGWVSKNLNIVQILKIRYVHIFFTLL